MHLFLRVQKISDYVINYCVDYTYNCIKSEVCKNYVTEIYSKIIFVHSKMII